MVDPRTPVLVGAGQHTERGADGTTPLALMTEAARSALADTGARDLARRVRTVGVADCFSWGTNDPAAVLAAELGCAPDATVYTHTSGTSPLDLLADAATRIAAGELDVALLAGAEAVKSLSRGQYQGGPRQPEDTRPTRMLGERREPGHPAELAARLLLPLGFYPLFEHAIRAAEGRDVAAQVELIGRLQARFAEVARDNPHAWVTDPPSAEDIVTIGARNRMAAAPYRKLMTANIFVDQGAALVVCSASAAEAAGIPRDNWVFLHATAAANDRWFVSERPRLDRSPAIAAVGQAALAHAGIGIDDVAKLDLYSCFPSAVRIAATELGIDPLADSRPPTVTGGLTFAGGPGSGYVLHSLAAMVAALRAAPDEFGYLTGIGWYLTKHAGAVLSARPPRALYRHRAPVLADEPPVPVVTDARGDATVETYTVLYDKAGEPERGIVLAALPGGERTAAYTEEPGTIAGLLTTDPLGAKIELREDARFGFAG